MGVEATVRTQADRGPTELCDLGGRHGVWRPSLIILP